MGDLSDVRIVVDSLGESLQDQKNIKKVMYSVLNMLQFMKGENMDFNHDIERILLAAYIDIKGLNTKPIEAQQELRWLSWLASFFTDTEEENDRLSPEEQQDFRLWKNNLVENEVISSSSKKSWWRKLFFSKKEISKYEVATDDDNIVDLDKLVGSIQNNVNSLMKKHSEHVKTESRLIGAEVILANVFFDVNLHGYEANVVNILSSLLQDLKIDPLPEQKNTSYSEVARKKLLEYSGKSISVALNKLPDNIALLNKWAILLKKYCPENIEEYLNYFNIGDIKRCTIEMPNDGILARLRTAAENVVYFANTFNNRANKEDEITTATQELGFMRVQVFNIICSKYGKNLSGMVKNVYDRTKGVVKDTVTDALSEDIKQGMLDLEKYVARLENPEALQAMLTIANRLLERHEWNIRIFKVVLYTEKNICLDNVAYLMMKGLIDTNKSLLDEHITKMQSYIYKREINRLNSSLVTRVKAFLLGTGTPSSGSQVEGDSFKSVMVTSKPSPQPLQGGNRTEPEQKPKPKP